jgi:excisionase family DNA binding protein
LDFSQRLDSQEAATYLGRSKYWLQTNYKSKEIPALMIGRKLYFLKEELNAWLETCRVTSNPHTGKNNEKPSRKVVIL